MNTTRPSFATQTGITVVIARGTSFSDLFIWRVEKFMFELRGRWVNRRNMNKAWKMIMIREFYWPEINSQILVHKCLNGTCKHGFTHLPYMYKKKDMNALRIARISGEEVGSCEFIWIAGKVFGILITYIFGWRKIIG